MKTPSTHTHTPQKSWADKETVKFKAKTLYSKTLLSWEILTKKNCWKLFSDPERSPGSLLFHMTLSTAARFIKGNPGHTAHTHRETLIHTGRHTPGQRMVVVWPVTIATGQQLAAGLFLHLLHTFLWIKKGQSLATHCKLVQRCQQLTLKQLNQNRQLKYTGKYLTGKQQTSVCTHPDRKNRSKIPVVHVNRTEFDLSQCVSFILLNFQPLNKSIDPWKKGNNTNWETDFSKINKRKKPSGHTASSFSKEEYSKRQMREMDVFTFVGGRNSSSSMEEKKEKDSLVRLKIF